MKKKKDEATIRSGAAEYLTYVASIGDQQDSIEMRYEDENIWLTQKMMAVLYDVGLATVYKGNLIKNLIMDCQSYTKYRPNETTGGIFVSWRRKEELPTGA